VDEAFRQAEVDIRQAVIACRLQWLSKVKVKPIGGNTTTKEPKLAVDVASLFVMTIEIQYDIQKTKALIVFANRYMHVCHDLDFS